MLKTSDNKLIVITGPTAVGKTALAIAIAKRLETEIVSADSRQIFKELTIGTAKPDTEELEQVTHHFINTHSIHEEYDAAQYGEEALKVIHRLFGDHRYVVLCGGSGLYIKAVCEGFDDIPEIRPGIREELVEEYNRQGIGWLQHRMKELDPDYFGKIDQQNPHRIIRALEVKIGTGRSMSFFRKNEKRAHPFHLVKIGLELPREELYRRIDARMDHMIDAGLFEEAEKLYAFKQHNALQTVGYQEIFDFMEGKYDRAEAIRLLKRNSRRYAKRQLTWFKKDPEMHWFRPDQLQEILHWIEG